MTNTRASTAIVATASEDAAVASGQDGLAADRAWLRPGLTHVASIRTPAEAEAVGVVRVGGMTRGIDDPEATVRRHSGEIRERRGQGRGGGLREALDAPPHHMHELVSDRVARESAANS